MVSGMMLIETLIALLVFSFGVLALVGMQARAVSQTSDARYRSDAGFLANQIVGRAWGDIANLASYAYAGGTPGTRVADWVAGIQGTLPGVNLVGDTAPSVVVGANNTITVTVRWRAPGAAQLSQHVVIATIVPTT